MTTISSSPSTLGDPPMSGPGSSAEVLEFICLFTHDLRRKQKRWQDGRLKYHTFNKRIMVYDERGNFIGDMHWRSDYDFDEGEEIQLERGGILVQVAECVGQKTQDLSELLDKRVQERQQRHARTAARPGFPALARPSLAVAQVQPSADSLQPRHRSLHELVGTAAGHHGRAVVPRESPFEQRHGFKDTSDAKKEQRPIKRRRCDESPPSKMGYAQSLFGTQLTLSAIPMSSAPVRRHPVSKSQINDETTCLKVTSHLGGTKEPPIQTAAISLDNGLGHAKSSNDGHDEHADLIISNQRAVAPIRESKSLLTEKLASNDSQPKREDVPSRREKAESLKLPREIDHPPHQLATEISQEQTGYPIDPASERAKKTGFPTASYPADQVNKIATGEADARVGLGKATEDGPRTSLRIKPRRKRGLLIMSEKPTPRNVTGSQDEPVVLHEAANQSGLAFQDLYSDTGEHNPFAQYPSPDRTTDQIHGELPPDGGKRPKSHSAPQTNFVANYAGADDGVLDSDSAKLAERGHHNSNRCHDIASIVGVQGDIADVLLERTNLSYSTGDSSVPETFHGSSHFKIANASKSERPRLNSGTPLEYQQPMHQVQCPRPPRQRRSTRKNLAASDGDEETLCDSLGKDPSPQPGFRQESPAEELPRVPFGPRLARLGRRSIRSKEVIGFVTSSPPAMSRPQNPEFIDEPLPTSTHLEQGPLLGKDDRAHAPKRPNAKDKGLMGVREEASTPSPVRSEASPIPDHFPGERSESCSAHSRQTAISVSPELPERKDRVTQTRAGDEHRYNIERQQRAVIDANSAKPASSPPLNLSSPTAASRGPSVSAKPTLDGQSDDNTGPLVSSTTRDAQFRSCRAFTPLEQGCQPGSMPNGAGHPVTSTPNNSNASATPATSAVLVAGFRAPAKLVNPATRGRKAALRSDAAGRVPESLLPPEAYPTRPPARTSDSTATREAPKRKMRFPGFSSASSGGPWSREAHDLLETGRPE